MKDYIKSLAALVLSAISSYAVYYVLRILDIVSYFELAEEVDNLQTYCVIVISFLLFNFLYGYVLSYSVIKNAILQGSYLLLSGMLFIAFKGNIFIDIFSFFNLALWELYGIINSNIFVKAIIFIACIAFPVLFSSMGALLSNKMKKKSLS
ncbi:MAG: hypothetical protein J1E81_04570 [Eubacterium sp.]|nr:hypothetical protein [Eubacterium sp.]